MRQWPARLCAAIALCALSACFGAAQTGLTASGKGKPQLGIEFPATVAPGAEATAVLTVTNPGPGPIDTVAVAFAAVGPSPGTRDFPIPLVSLATSGANPSVLSVEPEPRGTDGSVFTFGPLAEGEEMVISFRLRAPGQLGPAANSVQVYDGRDLERAQGIRLETTVER